MKTNYFFALLLMSFSLSFAQPPSEGGAEFNGIDEYIPVPDTDNINTGVVSSRTIETYFKVDNGTSRQVLFEEGGGTNAIVLYIESGYLYAGAFKNNGGTGNSIFFRKPILDNIWYHVALVLDNSTSLSFYIDGILQDSRSGAFSVPSHSGNINLGRSDTNLRYPSCTTWTSAGNSEYCLDNLTNKINSNYYFAGHVWGFRIWDVVRTVSEINDNKDVLITDTSTAPGDDLLAFLDDDFDSITYLDSDDMFDTSDGIFNTLSDVSFDIETNTKVFPANGRLHIILPSHISDSVGVNVYTTNGKLLFKGNHLEHINISTIAKGLYFVSLSIEGSTVIKKVIIN